MKRPWGLRDEGRGDRKHWMASPGEVAGQRQYNFSWSHSSEDGQRLTLLNANINPLKGFE